MDVIGCELVVVRASCSQLALRCKLHQGWAHCKSGKLERRLLLAPTQTRDVLGNSHLQITETFVRFSVIQLQSKATERFEVFHDVFMLDEPDCRGRTLTERQRLELIQIVNVKPVCHQGPWTLLCVTLQVVISSLCTVGHNTNQCLCFLYCICVLTPFFFKSSNVELLWFCNQFSNLYWNELACGFRLAALLSTKCILLPKSCCPGEAGEEALQTRRNTLFNSSSKTLACWDKVTPARPG